MSRMLTRSLFLAVLVVGGVSSCAPNSAQQEAALTLREPAQSVRVRQSRRFETTDRKLVLHHHSYDGKLLVTAQAQQTLSRLRKLWGFEVTLESVDQEGRTLKTY